MMRMPIATTINKLRVMDKVKELQATLRKLKASLQSIRKTEPDGQNPPPSQPHWVLAPAGDAGPPGGYGTWTLTLPDGRNLTAQLEPVPTLACDHRILYGADGAEFLARIRALLEEPVSLAL